MSIGIANLCLAAKLYLAISIIAVIIMSLQIFGTNQVFCIGTFHCDASASYTPMIFMIKVFYIIFWTWILNIICRKVSPTVGLFIALVPFILFFFLIFGMFFLNMKVGFANINENYSNVIDNKIYSGIPSNSNNSDSITDSADESAITPSSLSAKEKYKDQIVNVNLVKSLSKQNDLVVNNQTHILESILPPMNITPAVFT